jgi:enamine deaminase RidA (YjgF/YER057c/UK114 family)
MSQIVRRGTTRRFSDSVVYEGTIYLVEVPTTLEGDIAAQMQEVLASIERQLIEAGSDKTRLLMCTIYLPDMDNYAAMNAVWDEWVPQGHAPSRACVQAALANPAYKVEIVVTAACS